MSLFQSIREAVDLVVLQEILRGFNLKKFKELGSYKEKIKYARSILPFLGKGSSRIVFALSGGKVLKVARNEKGIAQNEAEIDLFTDPHTQPIVAKIYDADTAKHEWIIAEPVRTIKDGEEWFEATGFEFSQFERVLSDLSYSSYSFEGLVERYIEETEETLQNYPESGTSTKRRLTGLKAMLKSPLANQIGSIMDQGLVAGDLRVLEHYGFTIDGRLVLLDYGATEEIISTYYGWGGFGGDSSSG